MLPDIEIKEVTNRQDYPYDLLLLADETIQAINNYIFDSAVYIVQLSQEPIAVFCLYPVDSQTLEIKNIAVSPTYRNKGLGSQILHHIQTTYGRLYRNVIVGTADCGVDQIRFYERNGFVKYTVRKDFFTDNYEQPIYENGQILKDMIVLRYQSQAVE